MRIISGRHRGRKIAGPKDERIRPTSDRLRESLFNILAHRPDFTFYNARVADIFAGTGALGLESLSRGAASALFIDNHPGSLELIRQNIATLGEEAHCRLQSADARHLNKADSPFDILFIDAPYRKDLVAPTLQSLIAQGWLKQGSLIVVECGQDENIILPPGLTELASRSQGDAKFMILRYNTDS
jgi:16S rRNA (guanine966-N2)-methyltransferase